MKPSQQAVQYRRGWGMTQCSKCVNFTKTGGQWVYGGCVKVSGKISPWGVCNLWRAMANPFLPGGELRHLHTPRPDWIGPDPRPIENPVHVGRAP